MAVVTGSALSGAACECHVCARVPEVSAKPHCRLNLERESCSHLHRRGTERRPGLQVHQPEIQRRRKNPQALASTQDTPQHSHSSMRKCRHYSCLYGSNLTWFVLVFQNTVFNYRISFIFSYSVHRTDDTYLMSCCISFLCGS